MKHAPRPEIAFVRLTTVAPAAIARHMADPRVTRHMPLATVEWDEARAAAFVAAKEARWTRDGLGHWAILADGRYIGWGGFEREGEAWDFGLVLRPEAFGLGMAVTREALAFARRDPRIGVVTVLLPPSRRRLAGLARLGAVHVGDVLHKGAVFRKFRLATG